MKLGIIDVDKRRGNVVRFYIGDIESDYWGDDWDDTPYECNAGYVYDQYVKGVIDVAFPYNWTVLEPADGTNNSDLSKKDFMLGYSPAVIAFEAMPDDPYVDFFTHNVGRRDALKFYFEDSLEVFDGPVKDFVINKQIWAD